VRFAVKFFAATRPFAVTAGDYIPVCLSAGTARSAVKSSTALMAFDVIDEDCTPVCNATATRLANSIQRPVFTTAGQFIP